MAACDDDDDDDVYLSCNTTTQWVVLQQGKLYICIACMYKDRETRGNAIYDYV
jgi:hypothetical protein